MHLSTTQQQLTSGLQQAAVNLRPPTLLLSKNIFIKKGHKLELLELFSWYLDRPTNTAHTYGHIDSIPVRAKGFRPFPVICCKVLTTHSPTNHHPLLKIFPSPPAPLLSFNPPSYYIHRHFDPDQITLPGRQCHCSERSEHRAGIHRAGSVVGIKALATLHQTILARKKLKLKKKINYKLIFI